MNEECDRTELRLDDERPNSGLREGEISHVGVNDALRVHLKMVIFGQQTRLRGRVLLEDEKLVRFHAGHDLVRFFYGGVRQLPEYLVDALLAWGSVSRWSGAMTCWFFATRANTSPSTPAERARRSTCRNWILRKPVLKVTTTGRSAK